MIEFFRVLVILVAIGIAWTTTFWYLKAEQSLKNDILLVWGYVIVGALIAGASFLL